MILSILFFTGLFAGTIDAIAGGGGLISLPILFSLGVPPHLAFGTNKLQGMVGTGMATLKFYRHGFISIKSVVFGMICVSIGAMCGTIAIQLISSSVLKQIIPILLLLIFVYTILSPKLGTQDRTPKMRESIFYMIFGFGISFYDGFFGPGTGSFWVFLLTFFLGFNLIKATAYTKLFNLNSNVVSAICFALGGNIDYRFALCMALGQMIGGMLGAHLAITKGARLIRPLYLAIVSITIATLLYRNYFKNQFSLEMLILVSILLLGVVFLLCIPRLERGTTSAKPKVT